MIKEKNIFHVLLAGILVISWGSIFVRWVGPVNPAVISFYRLLFSVFLLIPFLLREKQSAGIFRLISGQWPAVGGAGLFLALHFGLWIGSLQQTSVGNSLFLLSLHPLFSWLLSSFFLNEKGSPSFFLAFLLAIPGIFLIVRPDLQTGTGTMAGNFLAMLSALCLAVYLLIARRSRHQTSLVPYLLAVYFSAALFLGIYILIRNIPFTGLSGQSWLFLVLMAIGPNFIGHSLLNWAARKIEVFKVNLMLLLEAVLATILAALIFEEIPDWNFYAGAFLIISAMIFLITRRRE